MKATRAYIAGLGTSGVLIASFLLLLTVGSAIVAFRGAPGEASNDGLARLDVTHPGEASRAAGSPLRSADAADEDSARPDRDRSRVRRDERGGARSRASGTVRGKPRAAAAAGELASEAPQGDSAAAGEPVSGAGGASPRLPAQVAQPGVTQSAPSVGGVAEGVGGAVEETAGGLGETAGEVAPPVQAPVAGAGETVGGAVEQTAPVVEDTVSGVTGTVDEATDGVTDAPGGLPGVPAP